MAVTLAKCTYGGNSVIATGIAKAESSIQTAGLVLSATESSGHAVPTSTGVIRGLLPGQPQRWIVSAFTQATIRSCHIEVNVGPPPYPA
jgi:hypothetical protein